MNALNKIAELLETVDRHMAETGFETCLTVTTDNFTINRKEVIIKMPFVLKISIPRTDLEGNDADVSRAISQAISQAISRNK